MKTRYSLSHLTLAIVMMVSCSNNKHSGPAPGNAPAPQPTCRSNVEWVGSERYVKEIDQRYSNRDYIVTKKRYLGERESREYWIIDGRRYSPTSRQPKAPLQEIFDLARGVAYTQENRSESPITVNHGYRNNEVMIMIGGTDAMLEKTRTEIKNSLAVRQNQSSIEDVCLVELPEANAIIDRNTNTVRIESQMSIKYQVRDTQSFINHMGLTERGHRR